MGHLDILRSEAYRQGREAADHNLERNNPYTRSKWHRCQWDSGYDDATKEKKNVSDASSGKELQ